MPEPPVHAARPLPNTVSTWNTRIIIITLASMIVLVVPFLPDDPGWSPFMMGRIQGMPGSFVRQRPLALLLIGGNFQNEN
eukprot:5815014-Ditylum_brightwellii.AAC.1